MIASLSCVFAASSFVSNDPKYFHLRSIQILAWNLPLCNVSTPIKPVLVVRFRLTGFGLDGLEEDEDAIAGMDGIGDTGYRSELNSEEDDDDIPDIDGGDRDEKGEGGIQNALKMMYCYRKHSEGKRKLID